MNSYVNWEITQLLPEHNPYFEYGKSLVWITEKELGVHLSYSNLAGEMIENHYIRQGWTFEDIRLYLESKNYRLSTSFDTNDKNYHCVDVWNFEEEGYLELSFKGDTYEEAREHAIKWCLTKINL